MTNRYGTLTKMTQPPKQTLSITDLGALDQEILAALCKQESISRLACYRILPTGATLTADTSPLGDHPLPVQFSCSEYYHTAKSKIFLSYGWQPITSILLKNYKYLKGWKVYLPVQDLWSSHVFFLIRIDGRKAGKVGALDGFLEALGRRLHHWLATDELRHFIDETTSQEHTHAFGSMLSQILSHEMRNPLTNLMSLTGTQEFMPQSDEEGQREFVRDVSRFTKQIWDIVQKIELLTDVDSNAFQNHEKPQTLDIQSLIRATVETEIGHHQTNQVHSKIILTQPSGEVTVEGVPSLLRLCVRELLKNAHEFGNGTPIKIGAFRSGDNFILDVEEDGMPIPPGHEELIFLRYFQGVRPGKNNSPTRRGIGLGLFLARFVCTLHAGQLLFVRGGPGRKGLFRMILPIAQSNILGKAS